MREKKLKIVPERVSPTNDDKMYFLHSLLDIDRQTGFKKKKKKSKGKYHLLTVAAGNQGKKINKA